MKKLLAVLLLFALLSVPCSAEEALVDDSAISDAVPSDAREVVGESATGITEPQSALNDIWSSFKDKLSSSFGAAVGKALSIISVAVLCSLFSVFGATDGVPDYVPLCGCAAIAVICVGDVGSYIDMGAQAMNEISDFSKAMLPAMCAAGASCGAITSSAAKYAASALFMDILITTAQTVILPLLYAYIAAVIAAAALDNKSLEGVCRFLKWSCTCLITLLTLGFTIYLGISSAITSSTDAVTMKLAKTALGSALPVVGGIMSDAASSVIAGAELIKNTVGVFGLLVVLAVCIAPFAVIGLNYLLYKAAAVGVSAIGTPKLAGLVDGIGSALGILLGLVGSCGIMLFISIISCMRAVTG